MMRKILIKKSFISLFSKNFTQKFIKKINKLVFE